MLIACCNMELIDSYDFPYTTVYDRGRYFSWGLRYTGTGAAVTETDLQFIDGETCDVLIWGHAEYSRIETLYISIPPELEFADLGIRCEDGADRTPGAAAASLTAGLCREGDLFVTTDGRLSTTLNHATVLRDGATCTAEASYEKYENRNGSLLDCFWVKNFYRTEGIYFGRPYKEMMTAPFVVEALIAVSLGAEPTQPIQTASSGSPDDEDYVPMCIHCYGAGWMKCSVCSGTGRIDYTEYEYNEKTGKWTWMNQTKACTNIDCNNGKVRCTFCHGSGKAY